MTLYVHDGLNRLSGIQYPDSSVEYDYDARRPKWSHGNRTAMTATLRVAGTTPLSGTVVTTYTYDIANCLTNRAVSDGRSYTYDWSDRGQMLAEWTQGYPVRTFTYDGAGQMVEATVFTLTTRFTYTFASLSASNGLGARVAVEVVGHGTTTVTLDYAAGNRILAEETITGTTLYLYGRDCLGELRYDEWLYYLNDGTGLVRQGVDEQGQVESAWLFDPDGTVLEGPEGPVSHLICGGVYDWSTGLIYKDGRYFDPLLGIWLALIPLIVIQSWRGRKKKRRGFPWYAVVLFAVCVSGTLMACKGGKTTDGKPTPEETATICATLATLPGVTPIPPPAPGKTAYLTFDDQPNALTPQVLEKLRLHGNIKATFNILGQHLDWAGSYMNDIAGEGHSIGLHSMNHVVPWYEDPAYETPYEQLTELMQRVTSYLPNGVQPQVWRAPGGTFEEELPAPYDQTLYRYGWDINPLDEVNNQGRPEIIYRNYQEEMGSKADDSIIILLHGWTPEVLDLMIPDLIERGYQFGVLPRPGDSIGLVYWD